MSWFSVDTAALEALAHRMSAAHSAVTGAARTVGVASNASAAGLAADALASFEDHWTYGLRRIVDNLATSRQALEQAARGYREVEQALAQAAGGE